MDEKQWKGGGKGNAREGEKRKERKRIIRRTSRREREGNDEIEENKG